MGILKVERFDIDVGSGGTYTLTNTVDTTKAFVRHISSSDRGSGLIGNTGNLGPRDTGIGSLLTGTNQLSFYAGTASSQKFIGEVWRYTGTGGVSEFVVRNHMTITIPAGQIEATQAITGLVNKDKVIPFLTGVSSTSTSVSDYDSTTVGVYVNSSGEVVARRGTTTVAITAYIEVVEFTGSNWSVGHAVSSSHDGVLDTVTLNTDSTGTGGSAFDVGSWDNAFIEGTMAGDIVGETGISDVLACFYPAGNTTSVIVNILADVGAKNDNNAYVHVLVNSGINATRAGAADLAEGNNGYGTNVPFTATGAALEDLALEWYSDSSGTGTAHARGRLNAKIVSDGSIAHWVHRSGNTVNAYYGAIDLTNVDDVVRPKILTGPDHLIANGNVDLTGELFGATQGTVYVSTSPTFSDPKTSMTINSWNDIAIQFYFDSTGFPEAFLYIYVVDNNAVESSSKKFTYGRLPYEDEVTSLVPDHYWTLDGTYVASVGANDMSTRIGTVNFVTQPITRGRSESMQILNGDSGSKITDSSDINLSALTARTMGGWIQLNQQQTALVNIYEEGGSVNNIAFFLGMGGVLIAQFADTGDDNIHVYSNKKLVVDRPYFIIFRFDYNTNKEFELFIDGEKQSLSFGNPLTATDLDAHSGDISWGKSESNLEVFGTDVDFTGPNDILYQDWFSWKVKIAEADIFDKLFVAGIRSKVSLTTGTEATMQTQLNGIATLDTDVCSLTIPLCDDGDFTLECDGLVFPEDSTYDILFIGAGTLTWVNKNGCNVDANRILTPYGGIVNIENPATLTIEGVIDTAEVRVYDDNLGTNNYGTELSGLESNSGTTYQYSHNGSINNVIIQMLIDGYEEEIVPFTLGSTNQTVTLFPKVDNNI